MTNAEKISLIEHVIKHPGNEGVYYELLDRLGGLKKNYGEYMTTAPIDCDKELERLSNADFELCAAFLTMLLREDHFSEGSLCKRYEAGQVDAILNRMLATLHTGNVKRCCFAGHSELYDSTVSQRVYEIIRSLVVEQGVNDFLVGNYGAFDSCAASAVRSLKKEYPQITLSLVIPYLTKEINDYREDYYKNFDSIVVADIPEGTPRNLKIIKANEYMVNSSEFIVCYVNHGWGGAAKTMGYAKRKNLKIFNLGKEG